MDILLIPLEYTFRNDKNIISRNGRKTKKIFFKKLASEKKIAE